jgi:molecular chaperone GrpE (heat shock protein)
MRPSDSSPASAAASSAHRQVWETLARLLRRLEQDLERRLDAPAASQPDEALARLEQELRRLGKAQFKANSLAEDGQARWEALLASLGAAQEQQAAALEQLAQPRADQAAHRLLEALLPALDGLENAIASGQGFLARRDLAARLPNPTPAQARLVSPADRAMLAGWLDGLRLVRERLLAVLAAGQVTPIPALGRPFDPYLHVAVGVCAELPPDLSPAQAAAGLIVAEERRGYQSPAGVLRFAEVIVYRPKTEGL